MITDLPDDVMEEILSRVPALHLGRSRFTCKRWNTLVEDPKFIKKHFVGKATKHSLIITLMNYRVYSLSLFETPKQGQDVVVQIPKELKPTALDTLIDFTRTLSLIDSHYRSEVIVVSVSNCDGLFIYTTPLDNPVVWNPCTGQTMWLKPGEPNNTSEYALGYTSDKGCHNYKILRQFRENFKDIKEIYEFSSNSWRVLDHNFTKICVKRSSAGVSLKGNTYWVALPKDKEGDVDHLDRVLLSFDFSTERFGRLHFPFRNDHYSYYSDMSLAVVREEQLAVLHWETHRYELEIWESTKIETTNVSWSFFLKVGLYDIPHLRRSFYASFLIDHDKKFVVCCHKHLRVTRDFVYVIGEKEAKFREVSLGEYTENLLWWPITLNYVPSLVRF